MSKSSSFWAWGGITRRSQLAKEEKQKLDALRVKLNAETQPQLQAGIKEAMEAVKKEYKDKRRSADHGLYARH